MQIKAKIKDSFLYKIFDFFLKNSDFFLKNSEISLKNRPFCVAVSGGVDSMALVFCAKIWAEENDSELYCVTVDHHLRDDSTKEAQQVSETLKQHNIQHDILNWEHPPIQYGIQEKARRARYDLLHDYCQENNISILMTAHHLLDKVETYYLRKAKKSGIVGLAAMQAKSYFKRLSLLRPFLKCDKQDLIQFCEQYQIPWYEDASNENVKYTRNSLRKKLSEQDINDAKVEITKAQDQKKVLYQFILEKAKQILLVDAWGGLQIDLALAPDLLTIKDENLYFWGILLRIFTGNDYAPKFEKRKQLLERLSAKETCTATLSGAIIERKKDKIFIYREQKAIEKCKRFIQNGETIIWDNRFEIILDLQNQIFEHSCWEIVLFEKKYDLFRHIPFIKRKTIPILKNTCIGDCIIFPFEGKLMYQEKIIDLGEECRFKTVFLQSLFKELMNV